MKVVESFSVPLAQATLWAFIQDFERVARCLPGVEQVAITGVDDLELVVTQRLGPFSVTFDTKMHIDSRDEGRSVTFTAVGQSIRGAAGNVRATNIVSLAAGADGSTLVTIDADVALGGMLGAVGQKVVAKQATKVTQQFAANLAQGLAGATEGGGG